jgi:hypothetical protein
MKPGVLLLCGTMLLIAISAGADEDERRGRRDQEEDHRVHELMERIHEGRKSPYGRLRRIAAGEVVPWDAVARAVQELEPMRRALLESADEDIKGSADGYADAVQEMAAAVRNRDAAGVRVGFQSLTQSCGDCHFDGGVGGELDDDLAPERDRRRENRD